VILLALVIHHFGGASLSLKLGHFYLNIGVTWPARSSTSGCASSMSRDTQHWALAGKEAGAPDLRARHAGRDARLSAWARGSRHERAADQRFGWSGSAFGRQEWSGYQCGWRVV